MFFQTITAMCHTHTHTRTTISLAAVIHYFPRHLAVTRLLCGWLPAPPPRAKLVGCVSAPRRRRGTRWPSCALKRTSLANYDLDDATWGDLLNANIILQAVSLHHLMVHFSGINGALFLQPELKENTQQTQTLRRGNVDLLQRGTP